MPHIHTQPGQHDFTASAHIIRRDMDVPRILLIAHKKLGILLQPGGHVELDENPWQAICHELREETGYSIDDLKVLQPSLRIQPTAGVKHHPVPLWMNTHQFVDESHFHTDTMYLLEAHAAPPKLPQEGESQDLRWVSELDIEQLSDQEIYPNTRQVALQVLQLFADEWQPVSPNQFS